MKQSITTLTLLALLALLVLAFGFSFTAAQQDRVRQIEVTPQVIANQPAGKPYVLDLSRSGTIYDIAKGVDLSRIRIRRSQGDLSMTDLIQRRQGSGRMVLGMVNDIRSQILEPGSRKVSTSGSGSPASFVNCDAGINPHCHCSGWRDCIGLAVGKVSCDFWSCSFPDPPADPIPYCTCSTTKRAD
jgi:hypothetical protein